ncbi:MAG: nucleotidyltransferase substrate binding protein [Oscillospiraceae bacterium]|nr:nucleotidyltransferase substrate binding protein [Oscillospiraceae bacterium]
MKKYDNFCKSFANLKEGSMLEEPYTIVEQTGIVGLFEICFEQSWKLMKEILEKHGRFEEKIGSPRAIIKIAYQCGMINNCESWIELLESRNILAHSYSDEQALYVIRKLKSDYISLFETLKNEIDSRWLDSSDL